MKFKIHAKEVRRAAKSKNLKIKGGVTVQKEEYDYYGPDLIGAACPIGALYCKEKDIDLSNEEAVSLADEIALDWGRRRYGKYYVDGFVAGFDSPNTLEYELELADVKGSAKKSFINGYKNGEMLARYLLDN